VDHGRHGRRHAARPRLKNCEPENLKFWRADAAVRGSAAAVAGTRISDARARTAELTAPAKLDAEGSGRHGTALTVPLRPLQLTVAVALIVPKQLVSQKSMK